MKAGQGGRKLGLISLIRSWAAWSTVTGGVGCSARRCPDKSARRKRAVVAPGCGDRRARRQLQTTSRRGAQTSGRKLRITGGLIAAEKDRLAASESTRAGRWGVRSRRRRGVRVSVPHAASGWSMAGGAKKMSEQVISGWRWDEPETRYTRRSPRKAYGSLEQRASVGVR